MNLDELFKKSELIPCIVQEDTSGDVLMLAYMNRASLELTLQTGETHFWSRSRQELWHKGATSGHTQRVVSLYADCDSDTLLCRVNQKGAACHTGRHSCFFKEIKAQHSNKE
ncbi:MAG: phosphoribosyl-AMP cyclohydrolase [Clostridium sp.]|jgi:phosphoribosyl-AMP cyclohydrolase|nr:phosphoribosyl-AMP cyclohydrolase [Clostridium sp.]